MKTIFDEIVDRRGTGAIKLDWLDSLYGRNDLIPMWVADMDFKAPDCIREALERRIAHQIYGYSSPCDGYWRSIINWERNLHGWNFTRDEVTYIPGIVKGIAYVIQCFTAPGDKILVQPPVYMPFLNLPKNNDRKLVFNPLIYSDNKYSIDFDGLERVCRDERPKLMILANPHNPAGIVWGREVLATVADICAKYDVLVISDEIHADMALFGSVHVPFAMASGTAADISITFAAPSKTFNMAGIVSSFTVVHNPSIRKKFFEYLSVNEFDSPTFAATVATEAAYSAGEEWRKEMLEYVEGNVIFLRDYLESNISGIVPVMPQASFLVWLDCNGLRLSHDELVDLFVNRARLALNDGVAFGTGGDGFMRMNVGCPRRVLAQALDQLAEAVKNYEQGS